MSSSSDRIHEKISSIAESLLQTIESTTLYVNNQGEVLVKDAEQLQLDSLICKKSSLNIINAVNGILYELSKQKKSLITNDLPAINNQYLAQQNEIKLAHERNIEALKLCKKDFDEIYIDLQRALNL